MTPAEPAARRPAAPPVRVRLGLPGDIGPVTAIRQEAVRTSTGLWIDEVPTPEASAAWYAGQLERGTLLVAVSRGGEDCASAPAPEGRAGASADRGSDEGTSAERTAQQRGEEPVLVTRTVAAGPPEHILGYACFGPLREYSGYRFTAEDSIYLIPEAQGHGVGRLLLEHLVELAREHGMHSISGLIEAGNTASIRLHERCGFVEVGRMPQAGRKFETWWDLVILQRLLEDDGPAAA